MKLGAEPKKIAILAGLLLVAAISTWINFSSEGSGPAPANRPAPTAKPNPQTAAPGETAATATPPRGGLVRGTARGRNEQDLSEFRPVFKSERRGQVLDPTKVDPALRTDLLAKLHEVRMTGPGRNLFQFGQAPPPPRPPEPKIIPKAPSAEGPGGGLETPKPAEPVKPPPPPIPLRYYGYADPRQSGIKRAFFMEGEEIRIAGEGELIKQRFQVVQIGPKSAVVVDTQYDNRQTLTIQAETGS